MAKKGKEDSAKKDVSDERTNEEEHQENKLETTARNYTAEDIPEDLHEHAFIPELPEKSGFLRTIRSYWEKMRPRKAWEYALYATQPTFYALLKMPPKLHKQFNDVLGLATVAGAKSPIPATVLGGTYAVSQVIYGIKKSREGNREEGGRHILSGVQGVATTLEGADLSKLNPENRSKAERALASAKYILKAVAKK